MDEHQEPKNFEDICQEFGIWVLKYYSATFAGQVYLLWYNETDGSGLDKLLTFQTGQIFGVSDPGEISPKTEQYSAELTPFEPLKEWRESIIPFKVTEVVTYDMDLIGQSLLAGAPDEGSLEKLVNFVNLLDDYVRQDGRNSQLNIFRNNEYLVAAWDYYYQHIFWPRFHDPEKFSTCERPAFSIDHKSLSEAFEHSRGAFEKYFNLV